MTARKVSRYPRRFRVETRWLPALWVTLVSMAVGLPVLLAALAGDPSIPHDDAFAYSRIAQTFASTGSFALVGWNHPFSLSQEISLGPLASSLVVQQLFVALLAVVALAVTYKLLRGPLSAPRALLGTAIVAAFPGLGLLATSFMEDIPTYCAMVLTLVIGTKAIRSRSPPWLAASAVVGLWGFLTREQAAAALVAVLVSAYLSWPDRAERRRVVTLAGAVVTIVMLAELWRHSLANGQQPTVTFSVATIYTTVVRAYFTFGLLVLPATLLSADPRSWPRWVQGFTLVLTVFGLYFLVHDKTLILGNYLDQHGAYSSVLIGNRAVLPQKLMDVVQLLGLVGSGLLAGELIVAARRLDLQTGLFGALTVLGTLIEVVAGEPTFDRFLLPLVPVATIVILRHPAPAASATRRVLSIAAVGGALGLSTVITANGLSFDSARWSQATALTRAGASPQDIDAGLEWVGFHSPYPAVDARPIAARRRLPWYAQQLYPRAPECVVLSNSLAPQLGRLVRRAAYHTFLVVGTSYLYVYDTGRCPGVRL